jgi:hypothetical protein
VRREFENGRDETDPEKIEALKAACVHIRHASGGFTTRTPC